MKRCSFIFNEALKKNPQILACSIPPSKGSKLVKRGLENIPDVMFVQSCCVHFSNTVAPQAWLKERMDLGNVTA